MPAIWDRQKGINLKQMEKIAFFTADKEKAADLEALLKELSITAVRLTYKDLGRSVGDIFGLKVNIDQSPQIPPMYVQPDLVIFYGLMGPRLDEVLAVCRTAGAADALKAVVTPSNCSWSIYTLTQELKKEAKHLNRP